MAEADLLRLDVSDQLSVTQCTITVDVLPDWAHANYCFHYVLKRTAAGPDSWREVFAYPTKHVVMLGGGAQPGSPRDDGPGHDGLHYKVTPHGDRGETSRLLIDFDRVVPVGGSYEFHYRCRTRVESAQTRSILGSRGAVWYWCAHEFPVKSINIIMNLPRGSIIIAKHPDTGDDSNPRERPTKMQATATFERRGLVALEFVVGLVTNETRRFGLPVRYARTLEIVGAVLIGAAGSLLANLVW
jgi:hypothetical protein